MPRVSSVACLLLLLGLFTAHARGCQPPDCDHPDCGTCGELGSITHTQRENLQLQNSCLRPLPVFLGVLRLAAICVCVVEWGGARTLSTMSHIVCV